MNAKVIWITGYSGSGKTTVARKVSALLRAQGVGTIHLDGDELRSIFSGKWGYERKDRLELARTYFRLSSHLAAQQVTVIISAVAMYNEIRDWVQENIPGSVQIYLRVPENERLVRDAASKKVYTAIGGQKDLYDEALSADLIVENYDEITPEIAAQTIFNYCLNFAGAEDGDRGRKRHWARYYEEASIPVDASSYAQSVLPKIAKGARLLEIGCGNGRDAAFFASADLQVTGIDMSEEAITLCKNQHPVQGLQFFAGKLPELSTQLPKNFDVIYSRFCLHAMTDIEEKSTLAAAHLMLKKGGKIFIECRSINDPMARLGEVISANERIHGHYRRFIIEDDLINRLQSIGYKVLEIVESNGLAKLGADDPVVLRLTAEKN